MLHRISYSFDFLHNANSGSGFTSTEKTDRKLLEVDIGFKDDF